MGPQTCASWKSRRTQGPTDQKAKNISNHVCKCYESRGMATMPARIHQLRRVYHQKQHMNVSKQFNPAPSCGNKNFPNYALNSISPGQQVFPVDSLLLP